MRDDSPGWEVPGYVQVEQLGSGAQGRVVLARHHTGGPAVAIKYLAPGLLANTGARMTFRSEAELLRRVADPHVARLFYYVESPQGAAIVLEAVPGRTLRRVLDEHDEPLAPESALTMLKGSLLGLAAAHAVGVVHRDYKPANVLVQDDGQSKLIDFGIAVLTGQGDQAGTPAYMAPEQWEGEPATPATDLYAATCVFVECVSGKKPFQGTTAEALRAEHTTAPVPLAQVPEPLRPLVQRGLAKNPAERAWNAHEFVSELEALAVREYGPDWERRGVIALGAVAAAVGTAVPLAVLGGALLAHGASSTGVGAVASGVASHAAAGYMQSAASADAAAKAGASTSKGVLAKIGGTKGAAGLAAAGVGAAAVAWYFWPGPGVGGESHGAVHAAFTRPGVLLGQPNMPAAETPYIDLKITVKPARAKPGTEVRLVFQFRARTVGGAYYLPGGRRQCLGKEGELPKTNAYNFGIGEASEQLGLKNEDFIAFYRVPPAKAKELPKKADGVYLPAARTIAGESQPFVPSECAYQSRWTETRTIALPDKDLLAPGKYLVTPYAPVKMMRTTQNNKPIAPEAAGAFAQGRLPMIQVLDG
ncbi:serine/threonine-protein kinase [Actinomadura violacea]|uniref:Serine/threonine protein kinase n=1 Tax=Actinomadura violacea TaxID=2819934 RepID=A0ABS3RPB3_9ACTN|nr:serine/threonine-protein kinase [Actinomadura violacea]MBO2458585.1 serine/threonine protein kinase [Actinomadura violacea]